MKIIIIIPGAIPPELYRFSYTVYSMQSERLDQRKAYSWKAYTFEKCWNSHGEEWEERERIYKRKGRKINLLENKKIRELLNTAVTRVFTIYTQKKNCLQVTIAFTHTTFEWRFQFL